MFPYIICSLSSTPLILPGGLVRPVAMLSGNHLRNQLDISIQLSLDLSQGLSSPASPRCSPVSPEPPTRPDHESVVLPKVFTVPRVSICAYERHLRNLMDDLEEMDGDSMQGQICK